MNEELNKVPEPGLPEATSSQVPTSGAGPDVYKLAAKVSGELTKLAGVEKLEGFSLSALFSEVFKKHPNEEVENYFTVGTPATTPALTEVEEGWPRPWVFFRMFLFVGFVYLCFLQAWNEFHNINLVPGLIMVGSFAVPISALVFFFEMNTRKNVSLYQLMRLVFLGGVLSLIISLIFFEISDNLKLNWLGASVAGLVEEPGKLLALLIVVNIPRYKYTLNGLLFGAAIGTGFAAFESAGYALYAGLNNPDPDAMKDSIVIRGMLAPFAHIALDGYVCGCALENQGRQAF